MPSVNRKETYADLPAKQRAIIDARAEADLERPDKPNTEIAEELETNRSYVSQVVNVQEHILEERKAQLERERAAASPEGDGQKLTWRGTAASEAIDDRGGVEIRVTITRDDLDAFMRGEVPDRFMHGLLVAIADKTLPEN